MTNYIDQNILPDEKILYRTKKHYIIFFRPVVWTLATIAILFYPSHAFFQNDTTAALFYLNHPTQILGVLFAFIMLLSWANAWLIYSVSEYAVTTNRILMREGFFAKHINETRIATIANVNIVQGPVGQLLGFGTVVIKTFGGNDDPFIEIPNPLEFKKQLEIQLNQLQKRP